MDRAYKGLLFIGDPHLSSRIPGFRKDDYTSAILKKLAFALRVAEEQQLLPIILGDLFHLPRDNSNRLLTNLLRMLEGRLVLSVTGNHDTTESELQDEDSLSVIVAAGRLHLLDRAGPWRSVVNGIPLHIAGIAWSERIPEHSALDANQAMGIWVTHHNIGFVHADGLPIKPREIPGVHLVVNGHLHKPAEEQRYGMTTWMNPGSIARVARSESLRDFIPAALKFIPLATDRWCTERIALPHDQYENVFYSAIAQSCTESTGSAFIHGLESIRSNATEGGAGLVQFINHNIGQFEDRVAAIILELVKEVCPNEFTK